MPSLVPQIRRAALGTGLVVGAVLIDRARLRAGRARTEADYARREATAEAMAQEHSALHAVASLVARGAPLSDVCARVAEAAAELLSGEVGLVVRFDDDRRATLIGRLVADDDIDGYPRTGEQLHYKSAGAIGTVLAHRRTARVASGAPSPFRASLGQRVATPIELEGQVWGAIAVAGSPGTELPIDAEIRMERFAELVALAIGNAEARAQLLDQANTDPLTGLANNRVFRARLVEEVVRSERYGRSLSLVVIDVDHFKSVNDSAGHLAGDEVLAEVAQRIGAAVRRDALVARLGGDEFAVILPECDRTEAYQVAERARVTVGGDPIGDHRRITVSTGVSELELALTAEELLARADEALYEAKACGRDASSLYSPQLAG